MAGTALKRNPIGRITTHQLICILVFAENAKKALEIAHKVVDGKLGYVTGGLKVLNFGGIKMPTSTAFGFETKGCIDAEIGGLSHVERTT